MNAMRKKIAGAAVGGSLLLGGAIGALSSSGAANAADDPTTSTTVAVPSTDAVTPTTASPVTPAPAVARDPSKGGHTANGITEVLLTGDTATQANAAALAAVPGGTVERVETDAEGAAYEAHMTKADGSRVTVKFDASFNVTSIEDGAK